MKPFNKGVIKNTPVQELGVAELIAIGVGGMIGGGIFSILGLAVDVAGHAAPLAFLIGSVIAVLAGYSYVRLALTYRGDGASFTYLERAFPTTLSIAGVAGWTVVVGYVATLALYAFTFGAYASHLFGLEHSPVAREALAGGILLLFLAINFAGTKAMGKAEDIAVYLKILLLAILAAVGLHTASADRFQPLFDRGGSSVLLGGALIFVAYEGFQLITNAVCETRNPDRNIPLGLFGSIVITSLIYTAIAIVAVGNLDVTAMHAAEEYALAEVAKPIMGKLGVVLVDVAAMLATASAINATIFGASHLAFEIARDNLAPKAFSYRNRSGVPLKAASAIVVLSLALTLFGGLELIASFSSLTFLLVSIGVCIANLRLRKKTRSMAPLVFLALALMVLTVILLLIYLAGNNLPALWFALLTYGGTGVGFFLFRRLTRKGRKTA